MGLDAITRIVGFFVSAMGVALIFDGVIEALESHGVTICIESVSRRMSTYDPKRTSLVRVLTRRATRKIRC
jgi:hypothetical protein